MIDATKIREAVQTLDPKDDSVWETDGAPKLELLKTLTAEPTLTVDDVEEAIGPFKRGDKLKAANKTGGPTKASAKDEQPPKEADEDEVDLSTLNPQSPEYAGAVVKKARAEDARLKDEISKREVVVEKFKTEILELTAKRDVQIILIEHYEPQISHAESVKKIQQQTVKTLAATRERMATAAQILGPGGTPVVYPSKLDAALGTRKRTQEQTVNYAKFVHQSAAHNAT